mmetsp:Transcript_72540/g.183652  ORF Transcript_72540/g.183652 Transcript_72540/m.183652 type:complete len:91 (+) Transcript_72540:1371-1643(+)
MLSRRSSWRRTRPNPRLARRRPSPGASSGVEGGAPLLPLPPSAGRWGRIGSSCAVVAGVVQSGGGPLFILRTQADTLQALPVAAIKQLFK